MIYACQLSTKSISIFEIINVPCPLLYGFGTTRFELMFDLCHETFAKIFDIQEL